MQTDINRLIEKLDVISRELEGFSSAKGGIVIHDTFANVSTWVNLGTTLFATVVGAIIGGYITIILFKKQEKMRIKQELRLAFFKEYKSIYDKLIYLLGEFKSEATVIYDMNSTYNNNNYYSLEEDIIGKKRILQYEHQKELVSKAINLFHQIEKTMDALDDYLECNKIILRDYTGELFEFERAEILIMKTKITYLAHNYNDIDKIHNPLYSADIEEIKKLKLENKQYFDYITTLETKNGEKKVSDLLKKIKNKNSKIEKEFLGKYFKVKWYKKVSDFKRK